MTSAETRSAQPMVESLTSREREILALMAGSSSNAEIANALVLSLNTVKWYNRQIYGKLGVANRRRAVARARELGLLSAPAPHSAPPSNLRAPLTPFLGRREELDSICSLLRAGRVRQLTITGPGGMGKTRLAIEAAACYLAREREGGREGGQGGFRDGVFFVPLASVSDPDSIVPSLAQAIGFSFYQSREGPEEQLVHYLRRRWMLLVLDNFEQLIDRGGASIVAKILIGAPGVRIVVTSRARLNILGEHVLPLGGLAFPDRVLPPEEAGSYSGIQLFLQAAQRVWPACCLDAESLAPVVEICELVQGMPLGIELAAAWMAVMKPAEIAAEIRKSLDFLATDAAGVPERQQSLRAVFDASWGLLTREEREAVRRLAVFRGHFDRTAAQEVCAVSPQTLLALANKSWIQRTSDGSFVAHELLKQYGAEKLASDPDLETDVRDRHSRYYCEWLCRHEEGLKGAAQDAVWAAVLDEIENVHAACLWAAREGSLGHLAGAANALGLFHYRGYGYSLPGQRIFRALDEALPARERESSAPAVALLQAQARCKMWYATCTSLLGNETEGLTAVDESLAILDQPLLAREDTRRERAHLALQRGYVELNRDAEAAREHLAASLALYEELGDRWGMAYARLGYGRAARNAGDLEEASQALRHSLALHRAIDNRLGLAETLATLGGLAIQRAEFDEAEDLIEQSLRLTVETDRFGTAFGLGFLGWVQLLTGRFAQAADTLAVCIQTFSDLGTRMVAGRWSVFLARARLHRGEYDLAREEAGALLALARELDSPAGTGHALELLGAVALAEGDHDAAYDSFSNSIRVMKTVSVDQRDIGFQAWLGLAARGLGRPGEARRNLRTALDYATSVGRFRETLVALAGIALMLAEEGKLEPAAELYASAQRHPFVANSRWFEDVAGREVASAASGLPLEVLRAARRRGQARGLDAAAAAVVEGRPGRAW